MGSPRHLKPARAGSNRRSFFKRSGTVAMAVAATPWLPLAGSAMAAGDRRSLFQHGVASGDPLADRVILWTRVSPSSVSAEVAVDYVVATDVALSHVVASGRVSTRAQQDFTVKIDVAALSPNTTYYYQFRAENRVSPVGRTKTLPVGNATSLRMAVVSCSNFAYGYFNAYRRIAERADLDMVVHLGDYLYEYGANQYGSVRACEPETEIVSLADYRMRHAQYKRDPDAQEMHRQHPMVAIWDDHETANDSWMGGAQNHQPDTEGAWPARVAAAMQAYYEWMPVRPTARNLTRNQRSFAFGNLVDLIMLEERLGGRSQQIPGSIATPFGNAFAQTGAFADASRQMLGAEEERWLFDKLRSSTATWKFLGQGVMFAQLKVPGYGLPNSAGGGLFLNSDQWDGYQPARNRVYDVIKGSAAAPAVNNVVVLTGDIHSSWAADLTPDPNNPDIASGGYQPATGQGSLAVEFVGTSVTSPGIDSDTSGAIAGQLQQSNPHFKYINLTRRGYMLVEANASRCVCEWWHVDTVASVSNVQTFATAFEVREGTNRLQASAQTPPRANPPPLAP